MISRTQIMRLLKYKNALRRMKSFGFIKAYSNNLGDAIGITSVQVRKDFSLFNISGNKKGGYNIDDLLEQIRIRVAKKERVLVTTLTKKMAEDLTEYLKSLDVKVNYMHSDTKALERMEIIRNLRLGEFDVLVGINLLREGLDIPEVSLVAILDADKEGFLRSERSLIQTIGRAARNTDGKVIMYADELTDSMDKAISETNRRRKIQMQYNEEHGIVPQTIKKSVRDTIRASIVEETTEKYELGKDASLEDIINKLTEEMLAHAEKMEFEEAAKLRDQIKELEKSL